ncbi:hypothetical protein BW687_025270 [Pseudomonas graminis]|uniref:hypothetical protein n=1 Tax=Pseudomonas graminis TaxID=158627 RepID=UPI00234A4812|nr:hypothetical protein [Pseudomonas graminis]MDC6383481.1 hypothetical protein [Pseudomonas graminis]
MFYTVIWKINSIQIGLANGIVLFLLLVVCISIAFIAHKYVDTIESHLANSPYLIDAKKVWGSAGLIGKVMRGGIIAAIVMMPKIHTKRGLVDAREVERLPGYYKKLLVAPIAVGSVLILCLIALRVAGRHIVQ